VTEERTPGDETPDVSDITDENTTSGGYSYTVVDDDEGLGNEAADTRAHPGVGGGSRRGIPMIWLAVAALAPAIVVGAIVWFVASGGGGGDTTRTEKDVANVVRAFRRGQDGSVSTRYEGESPPGIPEVPS
jgi:hypothetical protein